MGPRRARPSPRHLRGLGPGHMLPAGVHHHQHHRQGQSAGRRWVRGCPGRLEGAADPLYRIRVYGGRPGREHGAFAPSFYRVRSHPARQTVLILKYLMSDYPEPFKYYGYANIIQSIALMLSAVVLWIAQSTTGEYEYNLTL